MPLRSSLPNGGSFGAPGVYIQEVSGGSRPVVAVGTSTAGFVGNSPTSMKNGAAIDTDKLEAHVVESWNQFQNRFFTKPETFDPNWVSDDWTNLAYAVYGFFINGGGRCWIVDMGTDSSEQQLKEALDKLAEIDEIAIVAAPGFTDSAHHTAMKSHLKQNELRDRVAILDAPENLQSAADLSAYDPADGRTKHGFTTMYTPWLKVADPNPGKEADGSPVSDKHVVVPPSGHVAGIWARSDATRGVHKAPANEIVNGALGLTHNMSNETQNALNLKGVNAIRYFPDSGYLVWGARTLAEDQEWQYLNVRRLFNMIAESVVESTRWVVFEPNDEYLWSAICRDVGAFLNDLWRQGMLMGVSPKEAYFVKCDVENNPPDSVHKRQVVIDIGIAPVLPAEFVLLRIIQREAGADVESS